MLLCIDIGNTNIVYGLLDNDKIILKFRQETKINQTSDEYAIRLFDMFNHYKVSSDRIDGVIISSVVPQIDYTFEELIKKYLNKNPIFVSPGIKTGLKISIDNPKQLGADLLVGAVGACTKYGYPCTIIDMGTATTFTTIDEKKEIIGGIILPGVKIAFRNLVEKTSKLESTKLDVPKALIGRDTTTAIQSGMLYGTTSMIEGLAKRIKAEIPNMKFVLTGGISSFIKPFLELDIIYDDDLLLDGLNYIYKKNS